jgi:hypothetical protein
LRRDTLRKLLTHLIHHTSARVTFGHLGSWSRRWRNEFFRVKNKFWPLSPRAGMSPYSRTSREFSIIEWNAEYGWLPTTANTTNHKSLGLPLTLLDQEITWGSGLFYPLYFHYCRGGLSILVNILHVMIWMWVPVLCG